LVILAEFRGLEEDVCIRSITAKTIEFVKDNRTAIDVLAEELLQRKTLSGEAVRRLLERAHRS